jgi:hypothetical protein
VVYELIYNGLKINNYTFILKRLVYYNNWLYIYTIKGNN